MRKLWQRELDTDKEQMTVKVQPGRVPHRECWQCTGCAQRRRGSSRGCHQGCWHQWRWPDWCCAGWCRSRPVTTGARVLPLPRSSHDPVSTWTPKNTPSHNLPQSSHDPVSTCTQKTRQVTICHIHLMILCPHEPKKHAKSQSALFFKWSRVHMHQNTTTQSHNW